jgi:hypothetical protein
MKKTELAAAEQRYDSAYQTFVALARIHHDWSIQSATEDKFTGMWRVAFVTPHHLYEVHSTPDQVVSMSRSTRFYSAIVAEPLWTYRKPDPTEIATSIVSTLTGAKIIPPESRRQVRDVLNAAQRNAEFHFRVGVFHLMSEHNANLQYWDQMDDPERWEKIEEAYVTSRKVNPEYHGFMPSWRSLGIPMQVRDIYEEAYIDRAGELLATITDHEREAHRG